MKGGGGQQSDLHAGMLILKPRYLNTNANKKTTIHVAPAGRRTADGVNRTEVFFNLTVVPKC